MFRSELAAGKAGLETVFTRIVARAASTTKSDGSAIVHCSLTTLSRRTACLTKAYEQSQGIIMRPVTTCRSIRACERRRHVRVTIRYVTTFDSVQHRRLCTCKGGAEDACEQPEIQSARHSLSPICFPPPLARAKRRQARGAAGYSGPMSTKLTSNLHVRIIGRSTDNRDLAGSRQPRPARL